LAYCQVFLGSLTSFEICRREQEVFLLNRYPDLEMVEHLR